MKEVFLCKYGEIALKGLNKSHFESTLSKEIKGRLKRYGNFSVTRAQSTVYVEPNDENADTEGAFSELCKIFGIATVCRAMQTEKDMDSILKTVKEYVPRFLEGKKTFKATAKRADKRFPLKSPEIAAEVGGAVLKACRK